MPLLLFECILSAAVESEKLIAVFAAMLHIIFIAA